MQIPCLPEKVLSKLKYIFLAMFFFSEDRNIFGNERIFMPLITILNELYHKGIEVSFNEIKTIKFITTQLVGDNFGLNSILGFTESFVASHYCRMCDLKKTRFENSR